MTFELDHIGLAVHNLQQSLELYMAAFDFTSSCHEAVASQGVKLAMLPMGIDAAAVKLELLQAEDQSSPVSRFITRFGPGLHHLALRVDDLEGAVERLHNQGFEIIGEPQTGADNRRFVFVHPRSTGGVLLELLQRESL